MEHDFSDNAEEPDGSLGPGPAAAAKSSRYDFEMPEHLTVSDLLAIQVAECARLVRNLTDQASNPHLIDIERLRMVDHRRVSGFTTSSDVRVVSADGRLVPIQVDGDYIGEAAEAVFGVWPGALRVVA